jgi:exonuclease VII small subunit
MKKYLGTFGFLVVAGALATSVALAETGTRPEFNKEQREDRMEFRTERTEDRKEFLEKIGAERKAFMEKMKADKATFMEELKAKKEAWKLANKEDKGKFRGNAQKMIGQRFDMAVRNLERIQTRVGEEIVDLNEGGKNTDDAEDALDASKDKLDDAKDKLEDIKALIPDADEKVTPEVFEQIKLLAREAKDLLKESRENLVLAIKEVKELKDGDDEEDEN